MGSKNVTLGTGHCFLGLLSLILITLKLCDQIDMAWWWVLAPVWIPLLLELVVAAITFLVAVITYKKTDDSGD